jgi:uncharacterized DUF497 family protein
MPIMVAIVVNTASRSSAPTVSQLPSILAGDYVEQMKREEPEQFMAIGYLGTRLLSVIYEIRYDSEGEYVWLVTYWNSTKREREIYEQYFY